MLQLEDGFGVEEVIFTLATPLVLATSWQRPVGKLACVVRVRDTVTRSDLAGDAVQANPAKTAGRSREELVDDVVRQTDRLEDLRPRVRGDRRDTHFGHHLEDALVGGLDEVLLGLDRVLDRGHALGDEILDGFKCEVRVHSTRAVANQQAHVMALARIASFDDETHLGPRPSERQVVVDRARKEQGRDRCVLAGGAPVGQDQDVGPACNRVTGLGADVVQGAA